MSPRCMTKVICPKRDFDCHYGVSVPDTPTSPAEEGPFYPRQRGERERRVEEEDWQEMVRGGGGWEKGGVREIGAGRGWQKGMVEGIG